MVCFWFSLSKCFLSTIKIFPVSFSSIVYSIELKVNGYTNSAILTCCEALMIPVFILYEPTHLKSTSLFIKKSIFSEMFFMVVCFIVIFVFILDCFYHFLHRQKISNLKLF